MMYKDKFVVVVKSQDGKILREKGDVVEVSFASEYSLQFKNMNSRKAVINVEIDGEDVLNGRQLIIDANQTINLERFLGDDMDAGHKFKFIKKIKEIQEHRGDKIDDGFIRVTFQYEKPPVIYNNFYTTTNMNGYNSNYSHHPDNINTSNSVLRSSNFSRGIDKTVSDATFSASTQGMNEVVMDSFLPLDDEGITVKGSKSSQSFKQGYIGALELEKHVLVLRLKGTTDSGEEVVEPLTVNTKLTCSSCGKVHDSSNKFCGRCGTALI